ncbi:hypothetical protein BEUL_0348 [Bifidobacterium eulemuris]|uniref:Lipoprotein n=2 Tax=Bifidobacterium eulemuris TaxID=1765219 RepID=A0A261GBZ6_9BIFI|nr:hypothetical protein [Bifidobacterium eulemuris]OZG68942.1 hypothetical protein BEUL_0348 [Bifidobacterium eulemuris]
MNNTRILRAVASMTAVLLACTALTACSETDTLGQTCAGADRSQQYDWPSYNSIEAMSEATEAMYYARVVSCAVPESTTYDTDITVEVLGSAVGGSADSASQPASGQFTIHGYTAEGAGGPELTIGDEYVFFVAQNDMQMTPAQSVFPVDDETRERPASSANADGSMTLDVPLAQTLGIIEATDGTSPVTDEDVKRLERVTALTQDDTNGEPVVASAWWRAPGVDDENNPTPPQSTAISDLSPWDPGTYVLQAYCYGTGSYDMELTRDENDTQHYAVACSADEVAVTSVTIEVADGDEAAWVQFIPGEMTSAAAGFRVDKA